MDTAQLAMPTARIFDTSDADMPVAREVASMLDESSTVMVKGNYIEIIAPGDIAQSWINRYPDSHARCSKTVWVGNGQYFWYCNISVALHNAAQQAIPPHILAARAAGLSPYMNGALDAAAKRPHCPADFDWPGDAAAYSEGYQDEAGARFEAMLRAMVGPEEMVCIVEAQAQRDEMADIEFWRQGGW